MKKVSRSMLLFLSAFLLCIAGFAPGNAADFFFSDERFQGVFTTENLDAIIEEYELYDGWYWTTPGDVQQTFHGRPESPGWTWSAEHMEKIAYLERCYGCRWPIDHVRSMAPGQGGYGECFAFAQFIGYLLSGEINPQGRWGFYYSMEAAGGLKVGDIVRMELHTKQKTYEHSAVVYAVNGEEIIFMQVSGVTFNRISIGHGFPNGKGEQLTVLEDLGALPGLKISRCALNDLRD